MKKMIIVSLILVFNIKTVSALEYCNNTQDIQMIFDEKSSHQNIPPGECIFYDETYDNYIYQNNKLIHSFENSDNNSNESIVSSSSMQTKKTNEFNNIDSENVILSTDQKNKENILFIFSLLTTMLILVIYLKKTQK